MTESRLCQENKPMPQRVLIVDGNFVANASFPILIRHRIHARIGLSINVSSLHRAHDYISLCVVIALLTSHTEVLRRPVVPGVFRR
jgi:hypothetical protein